MDSRVSDADLSNSLRHIQLDNAAGVRQNSKFVF